MSKSTVFRFINDISTLTLPPMVMGTLGYLVGRLVKQIDPRANAICFAVAGAGLNLIFHKKTNESSGYLCLIAMVVVPYKVCESLQIPLGFKESLLSSIIGVVIYLGGTLLKKQINDMNDE